MTKKYLKENNLLAIPYDKGVGICVMKKKTYFSKMDKIIDLPQFEKVTKDRSNAKNPILKEEERVTKILLDLKNKEKISENLYNQLKPRGSQPARLYGLAKVHKSDTPMRPVLSMPGSAYHEVAKTVANWLSYVPECQINCSSKSVCDTIKDITLEDSKRLISFDVTSLYTNVPVKEAIQICAYLLFSKFKLPVDKETFITLAEIASCNVVMSTHKGFYKQIDGLAMGSAPAPFLANGWLSQYDNSIKDNAQVYFRYMDDVLRDISETDIEKKLEEINSFHPSLKFTMEREVQCSIPFLDLKLIRNGEKIESTWYTKATDTGLIMNFHSLAPKRYKRSVVSGFVHRIHRACSTWAHFHESLNRAKTILRKNQYPETFYESIIHETLTRILEDTKAVKPTKDELEKFALFVQYRGKASEHYANDLGRINAPCRVIFTLRKLKTVLPSLKPPIDHLLKSKVVYQIKCPGCNASYVGQTSRHLTTRLNEHLTRKGPVKEHFQKCQSRINEQCVSILASTHKGESSLLTLDALWIREIRPTLNTKDEFRSRELIIKI